MRFEKLAIVGAAVAAALVGIGFYTGVLTAPAGALLGSVAGIDVPALDEPAMLRRGAAHYDRVCARCHASPSRPDQSAALDLSPPPPRLFERIGDWTPQMLFTIVKHGVPGTGMPAWPAADRDDEIWAMIAFLQRLPELDANSYAALASLPLPPDIPAPIATCARCHGADGRGSTDGAVPRLDIQSPQYLYEALLAFQQRRRHSGFMESAVAGLSESELQELARHFGRGTRVHLSASAPAAADGPVCTACHGPPTPARPDYPSLSGQYSQYLETQFELLADRENPRDGGPSAHVMQRAARLTPDAAVKAWLAWFAEAN
jgi:cytochrome c553